MFEIVDIVHKLASCTIPNENAAIIEARKASSHQLMQAFMFMVGLQDHVRILEILEAFLGGLNRKHSYDKNDTSSCCMPSAVTISPCLLSFPCLINIICCSQIVIL